MNRLKTLSKKIFLGNKQRNIIGIFAIILTTILFTTTINIANEMSYINKQAKFYQAGKEIPVDFQEVTTDQIEKLKNHNLITKIGIIKYLGNTTNEQLKTEVTVLYDDGVYFSGRKGMELVGELPKKIDEIVLCEKEIKELGKEAKIGENITLELLTLDGRTLEKEFTLSGYIKEENIKNIYFQRLIFVSSSLIDEVFDGTNFNSTTIGAYLKNNRNVEKDVNKILSDIGYQNTNQDEENYIKVDINYAYVISLNIMGVISVSLLLFLFVLSGYLIIYNVFYISLIKDVKLYGQLKTIGTTNEQIKKIMKNQVYYMCLIGIPIGLILGYILSKMFLPLIRNTLTYSDIESTKINIMVFIFSGLFSFVTVWISCRKPIKIISKISPIESIKYVGDIKYKKTVKKGKNGAKVHLMAYENFKMNKTKTILLVLSLSISGALVNSTINFISNFNQRDFLNTFSVADFRLQDSLAGTAAIVGDETKGIPKDFIEKIKNEDGYTNCGEIYIYNPKTQENIENLNIENPYIQTYLTVQSINGNIIKNTIETDNYHQLFGFSEFIFKDGLIVKDGKLDWEKFNSGNYIIEITHKSNQSYSKYKVGDKIKVDYKNGDIEEYEVMAKVIFKNSTMELVPSNNNSKLGISSDKFQQLFPNQLPLDFWINVEDGNEEKFKEILQPYLESEKASLSLSTIDGFKEIFKQVKQPFLVGGIVLSFIMFFIGVLNYINITISNVYSKRKEYAMMRSIGLSKKQLKKLILFEGMWYFIYSSIISLILSIVLSVYVIQTIGPQTITGYFRYELILYPVIIMNIILFIIIYIILNLTINSIKNNNIVQELRIE